MQPALRKRHKIIWIILAIVLPILFITAILNIPKKITQEKLFHKTEKLN